MTRFDETCTIEHRTSNIEHRTSNIEHRLNHSQKQKALIVTLYDPIGNYGNSLQHYALQEILKRSGIEADSLKCERGMLHKISVFLKRAAKLVLAVLGVKKYREKLRNKIKGDPKIQLRRKFFASFYDECIDKLIPCTYREAFRSKPSRWNEYDYVITGSDQVWNMRIVKTSEALRFYYLMFTDKDKRVNYAPSFGLSEPGQKEKHIHKEGLMGFNMLSCREEAGCKIIRDLTGREAEHVLDPTLLLSAEDWRKFERRPDYDIPEHYTIAYFLGGMKIYEDDLKKTAGDLPVIDILDIENEVFYLTGPREFVYLIDHAECVLTNSFHGTIFSINLRKQFISFGKNSIDSFRAITFSRIESILSNLGLSSRIYEHGRESYDAPINYDDVHMRLNAWRESSMKYLNSALGI